MSLFSIPASLSGGELAEQPLDVLGPGNHLLHDVVQEAEQEANGFRLVFQFDVPAVDGLVADHPDYKVRDELVRMALTCPVPDIKLKAIVYYLDRMLGKPTDNVTLDVSEGGKPAVLPLLSAEEIAVLEWVVKRTADQDVVDVEAVVRDAGS